MTTKRTEGGIPTAATLTSAALIAAALLISAGHASAQAEASEAPTSLPRDATGRARMELAFDHGYGLGTEGDYLEAAADLRVYSPEGFGVALRMGAAVQGLSNAPALDLGAAYRHVFAFSARDDISLGFAAGLSTSYGPFFNGAAPALGGFAAVHIDYWHDHVFLGIGLSAHVLEVFGQPSQSSARQSRDPILTLAPMLRVGGDWGL